MPQAPRSSSTTSASEWTTSGWTGENVFGVVDYLGSRRLAGMILLRQVELDAGVDAKVHALFGFAVNAGANRSKEPDFFEIAFLRRR